jgi:ferric-dicitrate binding protein FerR (iron transport regulator)
MMTFTVPAFPGPDHPAWPALDRYVAGVATPDDRVQVERWCAEEEGRRAMLEDWCEAWRHLSPDRRTSADALQRLADDIIAPGERRQQKTRSPSRNSRPWWIATIASMALVFGVYRMWPALQHARFSPSPTASVREVITAKGQIASITLSDGSRVTVGVASRLTIPADFGARNRTLSLDGQALFTVTDNAQMPFMVRTASSITRVLGTTFMVRRYAADSVMSVAVVSGKVVFDSTVVVAGQQATRLGRGGVSISPVSARNVTAWTTGRIAFDDAPLRDVVAELNRWYGVRFVVNDSSLAAERVTVGFVGQSADEVAAVLDGILGTTHQRTSTRIVLSR